MAAVAEIRMRRACLPAISVAVLLVVLGGHGQAASGASQDELASRTEYERVTRDLTLSSDRAAGLAAEIAALSKDSVTITAALIQSAKTEKKFSEDIEEIAARVEVLKREEDAIRQSLKLRRGVLAEVLGALQRMGLNPPPALLVSPDDALSSVRSAILLGAVVPELRTETEILTADLAELSRVVASIDTERAKLAEAAGQQIAEKQRLAMLIEEKKRLQTAAQTELAREQARARDLAGRASSLRELIASLDAAAEKKRVEAELAAQAEAESRKRTERLAAQPVPEGNRLSASPLFSAMQGQIPLPVTGRISRRFGAKDGNGGVMLGDMVATQSGAIVTAPAEGNVLYAGPFRSYGQLLILNAGAGYHVVLAGMNRISVAAGQTVLAGEPIGAMGEARVASAAGFSQMKTGVELYVEFRKDGKPVDPAPWWADRRSGRTANDS